MSSSWTSTNILAQSNFIDLNLSNADFTDRNCRGYKFHKCDLTYANFTGVNLIDAQFIDCTGVCTNFTNVNLTHSFIKHCTFEHANFTNAQLAAAKLRTLYCYLCNFTAANFDGAIIINFKNRLSCFNNAICSTMDFKNFDPASVYDSSIINAGPDTRGFYFIAIRHDTTPMIAAGCHWFTLAEAYAHWSNRHFSKPALHAECLARLDLISTVAKARNWSIT